MPSGNGLAALSPSALSRDLLARGHVDHSSHLSSPLRSTLKKPSRYMHVILALTAFNSYGETQACYTAFKVSRLYLVTQPSMSRKRAVGKMAPSDDFI